MGVPPSHTLTMTAGDALRFSFQVNDIDLDNPQAPPTPRNLSGWTARAQIRKTATASEVLATWTIDPLDSSGIIRLYLPGTATQQFAALKAVVSDVELTDTNGDPETVLRLDIVAAQDVTR